jgi:hypothetical protein
MEAAATGWGGHIARRSLRAEAEVRLQVQSRGVSGRGRGPAPRTTLHHISSSAAAGRLLYRRPARQHQHDVALGARVAADRGRHWQERGKVGGSGLGACASIWSRLMPSNRATPPPSHHIGWQAVLSQRRASLLEASAIRLRSLLTMPGCWHARHRHARHSSPKTGGPSQQRGAARRQPAAGPCSTAGAERTHLS